MIKSLMKLIRPNKLSHRALVQTRWKEAAVSLTANIDRITAMLKTSEMLKAVALEEDTPTFVKMEQQLTELLAIQHIRLAMVNSALENGQTEMDIAKIKQHYDDTVKALGDYQAKKD